MELAGLCVDSNMFLWSIALTERPTAAAYGNNDPQFGPSTISLNGPHGKVTTTPVANPSLVSKPNKMSVS